MNPLWLVGLGWLILRSTSGNNNGTSNAGQPPRIIDASGPVPVLLPPPGKKAAPKGKVTVGKPTVIKTPALPKPPAAPMRSAAAAKQPVKPSAAPRPTQQQATAIQKAKAALPPTPAAARAKVPAPAGTDLAKAKRMAANVAANIKKQGRKYDVAQMKAFQTAAGLKPDGLYGPVAKSALSYFGAAAPAALFKGQDLKYVPPGG